MPSSYQLKATTDPIVHDADPTTVHDQTMARRRLLHQVVKAQAKTPSHRRSRANGIKASEIPTRNCLRLLHHDKPAAPGRMTNNAIANARIVPQDHRAKTTATPDSKTNPSVA